MADTTDRVEQLVGELTRDEKLRLVRGTTDPAGTATGYLPGIDRLDVPEFRLVDGPLGVRAEGERATAFPASVALAATFDPDLAREQGAAMAREAKAHDQDALLAPGTNLLRVPHCGRSFEYFSEDPRLAADVTAGVVEGIQNEDVVATVKHYVANNQEQHRTEVSADVGERTLRELYLPAFRAAVEAGVGSVMTAYNRVNGTHMSDHRRLVTDVLKEEWGFDGYVVSDWYGVESTVGAATAGLDVEMPGVSVADLEDAPDGASETDEGNPDDADADLGAIDGIPDPTKAGLFGDPLAEAVTDGTVPAERLDDMVARVLGQMERIGLLDGDRDEGALDTPEHRDLAERIAARGTVLLENDGVLPLDDGTDVALVGPNVHEATVGGGGSSETTPFRAVSPEEGVTARAEGEVTVAHGVPEIEDVSLFDLLPYIDYDADEDGDPDADSDVSIDEAVAAADAADVAVVAVRDATTEARDRDDLRLPGRQDELVEAVAEAADRTVVAVNASGPVELPWREEVDALLAAWYPGQAHGTALADVLYGDRDPAGRLPVSFAPEDAYPATDEAQYPGVDGAADYSEGPFVGYRHFDAADAEPTYPFGHGRSYADFRYGEAESDGESVRVTVENRAERPGREVVQAYVRPPEAPDGVERPVRELAGAAAVGLDAGETRTVEVEFGDRAFARYAPDDGWVTDDGTYTVEVARSSRDVRTTVEVER
ncbi:glycoside hydrolase family 3 C-terminal domain-containing protein [Halorussus gelatinilyticus]|uniref:Glycoside hydrolase family 3 C-terminal domain-containing protein n=1 Tax=Halorussus gelatinilyticus TaxID=2937524 RepID=A0A8U0IFX1_9EURY|nr:glycoside hydrolase family 3 C-terminal domain-containing protein [Halorussus gelatinilyticus]UPV99173.1 glycoside hydrolase family 3 C-terminal domain-containing protein [Halorussus gelatinilyticus]